MDAKADAATLAAMFPGVEGRMQLVRVMLYLRMPELRELPRDEPLEPELARKVREARAAVIDG